MGAELLALAASGHLRRVMVKIMSGLPPIASGRRTQTFIDSAGVTGWSAFAEHDIVVNEPSESNAAVPRGKALAVKVHVGRTNDFREIFGVLIAKQAREPKANGGTMVCGQGLAIWPCTVNLD